MPSNERHDAMPLSRAIGFSLFCLVTSACAIAETPEKNTGPTPGADEMATAKSPGLPCEAAPFEPVPDGCGEVSNHCCNLVPAAGSSQFGKAVWYDLVGKRTASGEILDTVTATAAHRSLPLASYAKVTNLDSGRSVIVKINDRGPYARGRIMDLSPRAADALDMKRAGVAPVVIEPLVTQAAPTLVLVQTPGTSLAQ
jgi:rare lipoprotein A